MPIAPQGLRRGVDRDGPAVGQPPPVDPPAEVPDHQIPAHLQAGHRPLEVLLPLPAEPGQALQLRGEQLPQKQGLVLRHLQLNV